MGAMKANGSLPMKFKLMSVRQIHGQSIASVQIDVNGDMTMNIQGQPVKMHLGGNGYVMVNVPDGVQLGTKMDMTITINIAGMSMVQHMSQGLTLR